MKTNIIDVLLQISKDQNIRKYNRINRYPLFIYYIYYSNYIGGIPTNYIMN
ncbi:hypothetical protein ACI65C_010507 [Semiaphis heraclei]